MSLTGPHGEAYHDLSAYPGARRTTSSGCGGTALASPGPEPGLAPGARRLLGQRGAVRPPKLHWCPVAAGGNPGRRQKSGHRATRGRPGLRVVPGAAARVGQELHREEVGGGARPVITQTGVRRHGPGQHQGQHRYTGADARHSVLIHKPIMPEPRARRSPGARPAPALLTGEPVRRRLPGDRPAQGPEHLRAAAELPRRRHETPRAPATRE